MGFTEHDIDRVIGSTLYGAGEVKIGQIGQVFFDDTTRQPEWVTVATGLFGSNESFVPVQDATLDADAVHVPYDKDTIKNAPNVAVDAGHLSEQQEQRLFAHYGRSYQTAAGTGVDRPEAGTVGYDTSGPGTDEAMTRSEEQLRVDKTTREAGRARLRKYIVTEQQTVTVPVTREQVRVEHEPITEANVEQAMSAPALSEEEHEVVLHEEQVVVDKQAVPVERVRLGTETVTEEQQVSEQVRKEHIEAEGTGTGLIDADLERR